MTDSISMSLILTLPLNKRTTMASHVANETRRIKRAMKSRNKKIFTRLEQLAAENKCDAFEARIFGSSKILCVCEPKRNETK